MSIGIFLSALLVLTMPGKCKVEDTNLHFLRDPLAQITSAYSDGNTTRFDFSNMTTYDTSSRLTTAQTFVTGITNIPKIIKIVSENGSGKLVNRKWPVKHSAEMNGDLILGGLMMVHEREDSVTCGPIMPQGGVQALETMLYTLDVINKMELLPNITMGAHILDDCDKDTYGLEMAVDFIKGKFNFFISLIH